MKLIDLLADWQNWSATKLSETEMARLEYDVREWAIKLVRQGKIDELTNFNLPQYDHRNCIDKRSCIGYENAQSDFDNEKELRLNKLQESNDAPANL